MLKRYELPSLNGLRAISIAFVLMAHLGASGTVPAAWAPIFPFFDGALGVRIFFCISGFLITHLLLREKDANDGRISLRSFYLRRAVRILPVNYVYVATLVLLSSTTRLQYTPCQIVSALTYTKNYVCGQSVDGHLWSLAVEEQFYLIWPFVVARGSARTVLAVAFALIAISPASRGVEYLYAGHRAFFWLPSHTDALMLGALGAIALWAYPETLRRCLQWRPGPLRAMAMVVVGVPVYLNANLLLGGVNVTLGPLLQALGAVYLMLSYVLYPQGIGFKILNLRFIAYAGILSYSLYIWQELFLLTYPPGSGIAARFPANILLLFIAAMISFHAFEAPLLKLRGRLRRQAVM